MEKQNRDVIGLDIAKTIFHAHVAASDGKTGESRRLRRKELLDWAARCEPALIGMEACATSQHWARELTALGHDVKLMPARYVKPYIKRGKSDAIDAAGIAEAVTRPTMRFVPAKSKEQQAALMPHRTRALLVRQRTALANALRNHFAEFGIVVPTGIAKLAELISTGAEEIGKSIPEAARCCFAVLVNSYEGVTGNLKAVECQIKEWHLRNDRSQRLSTIPGIGPITASAIAATITDAGAFRSGRDMAAWIGLVPRQTGTGGKTHLGRISKQGDRMLRKLLVLGATALVRYARITARPTCLPDGLRCWILGLLERRPARLVTIAIANKLARTAWAVLSTGEAFRGDHRPRAYVMA